jgi:hypothetical protein
MFGLIGHSPSFEDARVKARSLGYEEYADGDLDMWCMAPPQLVEHVTVEKSRYHKNLLPVTYVIGDVAGVVESSFAGVPNALAQVPGGRLNALAVTSAKRIPQLPNVPTMQEAGVAGYDATVWLALLAPAGTPSSIVNRLNSDIAKIMNTPETQKAMYDAGVEVSLSTPDALSRLMVSEMAKWGKVVKEAGIKLE